MSASPRSRFRRATVLGLAAAFALGPLADRAGAWGPKGHRIATRVAEARLSPEAKAGIRALLHEGDTLVDVCDWADHEGHTAVPGSSSWHFVNVPVTSAHYDPSFCDPRGCVVSKIGHFRKVLADRNAPHAERSRALLFLVHFVEDVHQPLHVGDNRDRGGNSTQVRFFGQNTNLHRVWDSSILEHAHQARQGPGEGRKDFLPVFSPEDAARWSRGGVEDWADESLQAAKRAYYYPEGSDRPLAGGEALGKDYEAFAIGIVETRLAQAGVRLANELNAVFADGPPASDRDEAGVSNPPRRRRPERVRVR